MHRRIFALALAGGLAVAVSGPVSAQASAPTAEARQAPSVIELLLKRSAELGLTQAQVEQLGAIDERQQAANRVLAEQLGGYRPEQRARPRDMTPEQREQARSTAQEARPILEQMQRNRTQAVEEALAVLTPAQREQAQASIQQFREAAVERRGRRHE